jgi:hypothetical protein
MTKLHGVLQSVAIGFDRKHPQAAGERRPLTAHRRTRSRLSASEATTRSNTIGPRSVCLTGEQSRGGWALVKWWVRAQSVLATRARHLKRAQSR